MEKAHPHLDLKDNSNAHHKEKEDEHILGNVPSGGGRSGGGGREERGGGGRGGGMEYNRNLKLGSKIDSKKGQ